MKKTFLILSIAALSGCNTVNYKYDGKDYTGPDQFQAGVDATNRDAKDQVIKNLRVQAPLSSKQLLIGLPSLDAIKDNYKLPNILQVTPAQISTRNNLAGSVVKENQMLAETIRDIGIYSSVKTVETAGAKLQPTSGETVLYLYILPDHSASQWYIDGTKQGAQAVNIDRGQPKLTGKLESFVNSVKGYALGD